jgi:hypothetical protein
MARGFESKSVEAQQAEMLERRAPKPSPPTAQESERSSLLLQRGRIQSQLEASTNPRYIEQQNRAIAFIDAKLAQLTPRTTPNT